MYTVQGPVYHWTISTGFSVAKAANFYSTINDRWDLQYCVDMFEDALQDLPSKNKQDEIIKTVLRKHELC